MQIVSYNDFIVPKSQYCVIVTHQDKHPYIGDYNYFKNISKPNIIRYCQTHDIDLVIVDDFRRNLYKEGNQSSQFNNRNNVFPAIASRDIVKRYKYSLLWNGNNLMHTKYGHFKDFIQNLEQYDIVAIRSPQPSVMQQGEYKFGWFGHTSIIKHTMTDRWFDQHEFIKFNMNDLLYRNDYHEKHSNEYKSFIYNDRWLLNVDYWCVQALQNGCRGQYCISNFVMDNVDFQPYLTDNHYVCTFFGGCGSYSLIWKLRYLLMKQHMIEYKKFYY